MMQNLPDRNNSANVEVFIFGEFELNPRRGMLLKNDVELPLRRQCFQVLYYLVRHHGVLVSKRELMNAVWSDVIVTESSLTQCILTIRRVLDDESKTLIRSIPRSGYLFDYPVTDKKTSPPEPVFAPPPQAAKRNLLPWAAAAIFLLALVVFIYERRTDPQESASAQQLTEAAPLPTSIAVLPFEDLSSGHDQEQIADGISEDVLNVLARNPNLVVIARASAFSFKGMNKDTKSIAVRLNVANVLEGSVSRDENRLHVEARLVDASAGISIWSQTYDLEANDTHLLQNRIANSVATILKVQQPENIPVASSKPEALKHYRMGQHFFGRRAPGDLGRAMEQFRSAVEIDPRLANAWVGLAGSIWVNAIELHTGFSAIREEYKDALDRALELDPDNPEAHARMAAYYWDGGQPKLGEEHYARSLEFGQNTPVVLSAAAGIAFEQFKYQQAVEIQQRAAILDPLSFVQQVNLALLLGYAGRLDESIAVYKNAFDLNPEAAPDYWQDYLVIYFLNGQFDQAEAIALQLPDGSARDQSLAMIYTALDQSAKSAEMVERLSAQSSVESALRLAEFYAFSADFELSFEWLEQAKSRQSAVDESQKGNTDFEIFVHSPFLQKLAQDARWKGWQTYLESQIQRPDYSASD